MLELRVSKLGWIGYYARMRVRNSGVALVTRRCLSPAGGSSPLRCGAELRGK